MSLRKHIRTTIAVLVLLGAVIAAALFVQPSAPITPMTTPEEPVVAGAHDTTAGQADDTAKVPSPAASAPAASAPAPEAPASTSEASATAPDDSANAPAPDAPAGDPDTTTDAPAADAEASLTSEELQRQVDDVIPHAKQSEVAPDAEFEPGVVLISVRKGTSVDEFSQAMATAGIESVEHDGVELVVDGLMKARLAPNATVDDAVYELESTGVAQGAQPNYLYEIAEEPSPALDDAEPATADAAAQGDAATAGDASAPTTEDDPTIADETDEDAVLDADGVTADEDAVIASDGDQPAPDEMGTTTVDEGQPDSDKDAAIVAIDGDQPALLSVVLAGSIPRSVVLTKRPSRDRGPY